MIAYVDTSILLRFVLDQTPVLASWKQITRGVTSRLPRVECLRAVERERLLGTGTESQRQYAVDLLRGLEHLAINDAVLDRAAGSFGSVIGTLDAIHLATALLDRETEAPELVFATHDIALAAAARAAGMVVIGGE